MECCCYERVDLWFDLRVAGDDDLNGRAHVELIWQPAVTGLVKVTLNSATGLKDGGMMDKCDPYVSMSLGDGNKCRGITSDDAGSTADFNSEELLLWCNDKNWLSPLRFSVFDDDMLRDDFLGMCDVDVTGIMGGNMPNLAINVLVPLNGVKVDAFGNKEKGVTTLALAELLGEDPDDVEDLKVLERGADVDDPKRATGVDLAFSLRKQLKAGMKWDTREERAACVKWLWEDREKVHESVDPKPVDLMER